MEKFERRDFLKTTAAIAGGTVLSSMPIVGAFAAGSDVIKVALIGCGGRGTGATFDALSSGFNIKVVALADAFKDNLDSTYKTLKDKWQDKIDVSDQHKFVGFDAYKEAIKLADVVILATPPGFRPMHFEEAVRQGKHVFMEKPVAVDIPGIRKVLAAAEIAKKKKLNVVVGLQRRYQTNYREAIKRIHDGAIGDVVAGQVYWNSGGVWVRPRKPGQTEMDYQMRNWYYFNWLCGDHIVEQHVHNIDIANWVKGAYPVRIQGTGSRAHRTGKEYGEIYDNFALELTYPDNSVVYSQCAHFEGVTNRVDEQFQATKGRAYLSANGQAVLWDAKGNEIYRHDPKGNPNPYQQEHKELFEAISKGEYKFDNAEYGAYSTLTGIIGRIACYTGKVIKWDAALKSDIDIMPANYAWDALPKVLPKEDGSYPVAIPGQNTNLYI
ncbi:MULTISPECIES: Gfo/Idh/MocA family oxidoreductase [Sphingobacterium]|jgi:myo-inositol 2-dehydrogenase/D-chiro-inositol 1-dehydrogenase|uniref:Gfo/Idh/MocA family oxidoreductase n=1 Tax=Sphingobacterium TaxID=28453 RepID=UPI0004E5FE4E|nr:MULTISPECIES: Gfo/Idh/MocA family oxidoreductase [Sphingobacterium]CDS93290.1 putative oxidoreductase [Sphingobacterium sp. PM2-P1-29]SJN48601.1 Myo-inositol 2-dehydrogenase [Sphingobacterium faecium PCAi_F2.5]HCU46749.1 gfo/Idh/MocA family oxidoreductase [Sphingobacterium sp.]UPZ36557.1 Gfo/Idh/MocA family oxidoreductase [Sphingobacterium sp. PCS056]UXD68073.1 Gfo/Idh/MocA family oxidoreductase [Sphingobacterium faecium]